MYIPDKTTNLVYTFIHKLIIIIKFQFPLVDIVRILDLYSD